MGLHDEVIRSLLLENISKSRSWAQRFLILSLPFAIFAAIASVETDVIDNKKEVLQEYRSLETEWNDWLVAIGKSSGDDFYDENGAKHLRYASLERRRQELENAEIMASRYDNCIYNDCDVEAHHTIPRQEINSYEKTLESWHELIESCFSASSTDITTCINGKVGSFRREVVDGALLGFIVDVEKRLKDCNNSDTCNKVWNDAYSDFLDGQRGSSTKSSLDVGLQRFQTYLRAVVSMEEVVNSVVDFNSDLFTDDSDASVSLLTTGYGDLILLERLFSSEISDYIEFVGRGCRNLHCSPLQMVENQKIVNNKAESLAREIEGLAMKKSSDVNRIYSGILGLDGALDGSEENLNAMTLDNVKGRIERTKKDIEGMKEKIVGSLVSVFGIQGVPVQLSYFHWAWLGPVVGLSFLCMSLIHVCESRRLSQELNSEEERELVHRMCGRGILGFNFGSFLILFGIVMLFYFCVVMQHTLDNVEAVLPASNSQENFSDGAALLSEKIQMLSLIGLGVLAIWRHVIVKAAVSELMPTEQQSTGYTAMSYFFPKYSK